MTDDTIKKYFLGELNQAEADLFEETCAQNEEFTERAQMIESEITDAYLRDGLSPNEKKLFESNYLTTEARRGKLKFAQSFLNNFNAEALTAPKVSIWQSYFDLFQPRFVFAGILTVLLLVGFGYVWFNRQNKPEIAQQNNTNQTPTPKIENQNHSPLQNTNSITQNANISTNFNAQPNKNTSPTPEPKPSPTPKPIEQSAPTLATFTLLPGTLRSNGEQSVKLTPNLNKVNLQLNLPKDAAKYQTYTATIKTANGETISTFSNLKSLSLTLPANKLEKRTYIIFVEGNNPPNSAESIAEYTFQVRR